MKKVQQVSHRQYSDDIALVGHGNVSDCMFRHKEKDFVRHDVDIQRKNWLR